MCNLNPISRTQYDREDHPRNQERFLHPSDGGRQRGVLPCERDGGPLTHGSRPRTELHAQSGSGQAQDGSSGCNPLHILNRLGKSELELLVTSEAAEAEQNLADVRAAFPTELYCGACHQRIETSKRAPSGYCHAYPCDWELTDSKGCFEKAAPPVVISSPAYFLPELKSDADHFAENYIAQLNRAGKGVPAWLQPIIATAYLSGQQDERLKGGK